MSANVMKSMDQLGKAIVNMMKQGEVLVRQEELFGDILIERAPQPDTAA